MEYEFLAEFLANHGILMKMFLKDMVIMCGIVAFFAGMFIGWLVTECRGGTTWKEIIPWPMAKI